MKRRTFFRSSMVAAAAATLPLKSASAGRYRVIQQGFSDLDAIRGDGSDVTIKGAALQELSDTLRGHLLLAKMDGYDDARRVLNPSIDRYPALIVRATGTADVRTAVNFAREHRVLLAVKCGGHSASGQSTCNRGMMIDLSAIRGVRVDPGARRARVAGGSLLGPLDHEAMAHGLVTPMGTVSHTGVGGLTTGGGFGRVARRFGLALDNLVAIDVVTADGEFHHASIGHNADLFWGIRGGGGNFGIVTSFEFQLHPMERQVMGGAIVFPIARAKDVLSMYADYSVEAPDELYMDFFMSSPPGGADGVAGVSVCYSGAPSQADRVLRPLRQVGTPLNDAIAPMDYVAQQRSGDVSDPRAQGSYLKGGFTTEISANFINAIHDGWEPHPARATMLFTQHCGGAIGRVARNATAFANRSATHNVMTASAWRMGQDSTEHMAYIRQFWSNLEEYTRGFYVNDIALEETKASINANYGENYQRLVTLKNKYDPGNLFRLNANVQPTA